MTEELRCYVINLDSSTQRLDEFNAAFNKTNLNIERISAVDGNLIDIEAFSDENLCKKQMGRGLQPGEVGCYLSHKKAIKQFLSTDAPYAIVFEDDAGPRVAIILVLLSFITQK